MLLTTQSNAADFPPIVTGDNLRTAILSPNHGFTTSELQDMDLNNDGVVDVSDLIFYSKSQGAVADGVNFVEFGSIRYEGDGSIFLAITVAPNYSGQIFYVVDGTASKAADFAPLSGNVGGSGSYRELSITLQDDALIEDVETIRITLIPDPGYQVGYAQQHIIQLIDNDSLWHAGVDIKGITFDFDFLMQQIDGTVSAVVVSDGDDGFPAGEWPVSVTAEASHFEAIIGPIPVASGDTLLAAELERTIVFTADVENDEDLIDYDAKLVGKVIETLASVDGLTHLERTPENPIKGVFYLRKATAYVPTPVSELVDGP